jgi:hypothetical protein
MFQKIGGTISFPEWAKRDPRYIPLDLYDRLLDGCFYDHLKYAFYDETQPGNPSSIIPLVERRPSAQFRLPRMVARWSTRKLWAGRHAPKLRLGSDSSALKPLARMLKKAQFVNAMAATTLNGSVGSIAVTFSIDGAGDNRRVAFQRWRAKYCKPSFDPMGDLAQLRVNYTVPGTDLIALGASANEIEASGTYWFIRDYTKAAEITYKPVKKDDWNPVDGFVGEAKSKNKELVRWDELSEDHGYDFVPGHWFVNLSGGAPPDGACTFADAVPNSIELDYTLSQTGRGVRYNSAPQLVIIGEILSSDFTRGPATQINIRGGYKDEGGQQVSPGDAKLLEMTGRGTEAALAYIDKLRNFALEQISASRKDPDKMHAPLSGRAMEYLDQDSDDLIMDLRDQYGDAGALPLLKKVAQASGALGDNAVAMLSLQWPRLAQPTPDEMFAMAQAFQIFIDPMSKTAPGSPGKPATATGPATPATEPTSPGEDEQIVTIEEARAYVRLNLDMAMLELEGGEDDAERVDDSPTPPAEPTPPVPAPLSIDEPAVPGDNVPANQPGHVAGHAAPMHVGAPVRVNA